MTGHRKFGTPLLIQTLTNDKIPWTFTSGLSAKVNNCHFSQHAHTCLLHEPQCLVQEILAGSCLVGKKANLA
jgi:hypothetical protein